MGKYDLVYRRDRAGRLVDAQTFEYLAFGRELFSEELLAELAAMGALVFILSITVLKETHPGS